MQNNRLKRKLYLRAICLILALFFVLGMGVSAFAEETGCTHQHDTECGGLALNCPHQHEAECYSEIPDICSLAHEHSEECGGLGLNCPHQHDALCYTETAESCTHQHSSECAAAPALCPHDNPENECIFCEEGIEPCTHGAHPDLCVLCAEGAVTPFSGEDFAVFGGTTLSESGASFATSTAEAYTTSHVLLIKEAFTPANTSKTITIAIDNGMGFTNIPAMKQEGGTWVFDPNEDNWSPELRGVISNAEYTPSAPIVTAGGAGYTPKSGIISYTLVNTAQAVQVGLTLQADRNLLINGGSITYSDIIQVESTENGARLNYAKLESYTINDFTRIIYNSGNKRTLIEEDVSYSAPLGNPTPSTTHDGLRYDFTLASLQFDEWTLTLRVNKNTGLQGLQVPSGSCYEITSNTVETDPSDPNCLLVTSTIKLVNLTGSRNLDVIGTPPPGAATGEYLISVHASTVTPLAGLATAAPTPDATNFVYWNPLCLIVSEPHSLLTFREPSSNVVSTSVAAASSPADMVYLGGAQILNLGTTPLNDKRLKMEFDTASTGVLSVVLPVGEGNAAENVAVTLNDGTILPVIPSLSGSVSTNPASTSGFTFVRFNLNDYPEHTGKYIQSIEYDMGTVPAGAYTAPKGPEFCSYYCSAYYYGKLLNAEIGEYSVNLTAYSTSSGLAVEENKFSSKTTLSSSKSIWYAVDTVSNGKAVLTAGGNAQTVSFNFRLGPDMRTLFNSVSAAKELILYVRLPQHLSVDPTSISAKWNGTTYTVDSTIPQTDNSGRPYYTVTIPDATIGFFAAGGTAYPPVSVSAKISALKTAPTMIVPLREIFRFVAADHRNTTAYGTTTTKDTYAMYDGADTGYNLGTFPNSTNYELTTKPSNQVVVATAGSTDNTTWHTYSGTEDSIIDLNQNLDAYYRVSAYNNTGSVAGYDIIVPVPKAGDTIPDIFKAGKNTFEWPLYLAEELNLGSEYTITYAGDYLTSPLDPGWTSYSAAGGKNGIKAIRITRTPTMEVGAEEKIVIPLEVPSSAGTYMGKVNIYSSYIFSQSGGNYKETPSEPIALRFNTGLLDGFVYMDTDRSGSINSGDTGVKNILVTAYTAGTDTKVDSARTDENGYYVLTGLNAGESVDLVFTHPGTNARFILPETTAGNAQKTNALPHDGTGADINALLQQPFTVTFNPNFPSDSGTNSGAASSLYKYPGEIINAGDLPQNPACTNYTFAGWVRKEGTEAPTGYTVTGDVTFLGEWSVKSNVAYTVEYYLQNLSDDNYTKDSHEQTLHGTAGQAAVIPPKGYTGFALHKTTYTSIGNAETGTELPILGDGSLVVRLYYNRDTYTVTYLPGTHGDFADDVHSGIKYNADTPAYAGPEANGSPKGQTGYSFTGWDTTPADFVSENASYTALWAANTHAVHFNSNGGSGNMASMQIDFGHSKALPANAFTRAGHTFKGWGLTSTGTAIAYGNSASYTHLVDDVITLHAIWEAKAYTLSFNPQGGSPAPAAQTVLFGDKATIPGTAPSKTGHDFTGWFTAPENGTAWNFDTNTMPAQNITLHAGYAVIKYTVTFNYGGAPINSRTSSVDYGLLIPAPTAPTWAGRTFVHWADKNGAAWDFNTNTQPAEDITLTAVWNTSRYTVRFVDWDGSLLQTQTVVWGSNAAPPANPLRDGYTFSGWEGNFTNITKDETVTAVYTANPVTPTPENPPPSTPRPTVPTRPVTPPAASVPPAASAANSSSAPAAAPVFPGGGAAGGTANGGAAGGNGTPADTPAELPAPGITGNELSDGIAASNDTWGLLNLLLSIAAFFFSAYLLISAFRKRKTQQNSEEDLYEYSAEEIESEKTNKRRLTVFRVLSVFAGVLTIALFLILDNMSNPMVWVNRWTPLLFIAFIAHAALNVVQYLLSRSEEEVDDEPETA